MIPNMTTFEVKGADGKLHAYDCILHPPSEGLDILWILMALGGEPLARLAQSVLGSALDEIGKQAGPIIEVDDEGNSKPSTVMAKIMDEVDLEQIDLSGAAADLRRSMATLPMTDLVTKLIKHCNRDGKPMCNSDHFNRAYTGNYMELGQAVWRVVAANNFLPQIVTSALD